MIDIERLAKIELDLGGHQDRHEGMCLMEAVAFLASEPHSDHPACTSQALSDLGRMLNDSLPKRDRQRLIAYVPEVIGTAGDKLDGTRRYLVIDWFVRTWLPAWLDTIPELARYAAGIRELHPITNARYTRPAITVLDTIWRKIHDLIDAQELPECRVHLNSLSTGVQNWESTGFYLATSASAWGGPHSGNLRWVTVSTAKSIADLVVARISARTRGRVTREMRDSAISLYADLIKVPTTLGHRGRA